MLDTPLGQPSVDAAGPTPLVSDEPAPPGGTDVPPRQCGRCRAMFDGDPTLHLLGSPDWWVCPTCRAILFGRGPGASGRTDRGRSGSGS
jgi:hypothetical protein